MRRGKHLGSKLGFPTANLVYPHAEGLPPDGVYVAVAEVRGARYIAVLTQGRHPTAPDGAPTVEAHLPDYPGGALYGEGLTLRYVHYLREEKRFDTLDALREQLKRDVEAARAWARAHPDALERPIKGESMSTEERKTLGNGRPAEERALERDGTEADAADTDAPIRLEDVSYHYDEDDDASCAVDHVTLSIARGTFVAVLGHNGSGKSTLAKLMNALYLPTAGRVLVCGMDTSAEKHVWDVRKHAGMVFQNPDNQIVATVVREDVAFGLENLGVPREEMIRRIDAALEAVRMTPHAGAAPHMLSGGQKQRVAIAGVLAMEPDVMILDEATAMLDPAGREDVLATVRKLNREKGITVVWITHFMEEAVFADRVVVLSEGRVAMDAPPAGVFARVEELKRLGLDVPPMAELARELRDAGLPMPDGVLTIEDMVKELKARL